MNVLAIETSGPTASVALLRQSAVVASRSFPSRMTLCQSLVTETAAVLGYLSDDERVEGIAVSLGPGSFTSLRIGVVTAKALAHQLGVPLAGVPTMEAMAAPFAHESGRTICVIQPAWRSALYLATYRAGPPGELREITPASALEPEGLLHHLRGVDRELLLVGEGALEHRRHLSEALGGRAAFAVPPLAAPQASLVAEAARERLANPDPEAAYRVRPLYVVASQAERVAGIDLGLTGTQDGV
jgi:tRNA threonylcarbamoyladenosine biosynthesis protein TsaB